jgi:hypothetical protein
MVYHLHQKQRLITIAETFYWRQVILGFPSILLLKIVWIFSSYTGATSSTPVAVNRSHEFLGFFYGSK